MRSLRFPLALQLPLGGALRKSYAALAPKRPIYAVGDIHGRADLLRQILKLIKEDAAQYGMEGFQIVFLGDYIDRGYDSARVLRILHQLAARNPGWVDCLMGSHERMMFDFLADPVRYGPEWLRNGGRWTLESFRITLSDAQMAGPNFHELADALRAALPQETHDWLASRPMIWRSGNVACVHAGADPDVSLEAQKPAVLLQGHPKFATAHRADGMWVVHGNTIVPTATVEDGRISVDTGAYATGMLSAVAIATDGRTRILNTDA